MLQNQNQSGANWLACQLQSVRHSNCYQTFCWYSLLIFQLKFLHNASLKQLYTGLVDAGAPCGQKVVVFVFTCSNDLGPLKKDVCFKPPLLSWGSLQDVVVELCEIDNFNICSSLSSSSVICHKNKKKDVFSFYDSSDPLTNKNKKKSYNNPAETNKSCLVCWRRSLGDIGVKLLIRSWGC